MTETRIPFARLRELLVELGFLELKLPDDLIAFQHERTDTFLAIPTYRSNQTVAPHHIIMFRVQLDANGILDAEEFDRRVEAATLKRPA